MIRMVSDYKREIRGFENEKYKLDVLNATIEVNKDKNYIEETVKKGKIFLFISEEELMEITLLNQTIPINRCLH